MAVMPPKWAQDCQLGQWVLFLDELTTCPPAVQAALLGVIAENRVGDALLPDGLEFAVGEGRFSQDLGGQPERAGEIGFSGFDAGGGAGGAAGDTDLRFQSVHLVLNLLP